MVAAVLEPLVEGAVAAAEVLRPEQGMTVRSPTDSSTSVPFATKRCRRPEHINLVMSPPPTI